MTEQCINKPHILFIKHAKPFYLTVTMLAQ